jgi:hypothetical protein
VFSIGVFFNCVLFYFPYRENKTHDPVKRKTFFITFSSPPHREALNQRNPKKRKKKSKRNPPKKNIPPRKNISPPGGYFGNALNKIPRVFELPLPRNAQTRTEKKKYVRTYFVLRAGADVRRFSVLFFCRPLDRASCLLPAACDCDRIFMFTDPEIHPNP